MNKKLTIRAATVVAIAGLLPSMFALLPAQEKQPSKTKGDGVAGVPDGFVFAAGGDLIGPFTGFSVGDNASLASIASIFHHADLGFANEEGSIFDLATFRGFAAAENGGAAVLYPSVVASDLRALGITIVSKANNHATDWGTEGLAATLANLAAAGIVQAGSGMSLAEARAPGYVKTSKGVAALVDTASTFPPISAAGPTTTAMSAYGAPDDNLGIPTLPRPGISPLHTRLVQLVPSQDFSSLKRAAGALGYPTKGRTDEIRIGDTLFRSAPSSGHTWEIDPSDQDEVIASVREARAHAAFVLFSIHAHETAGETDGGPLDFQPISLHFANEAASPNDPEPADFEPVLFHAAIEAGADAVVRTGPHVPGGIEIYKGKPIFYGLGSLFFPFGNHRKFITARGEPRSFADECFETFIPVSTFKNGKVHEIRLYPVAIETKPGPTLGFPHPATPQQSLAILERVKTLSLPFHTTIEIEDGVGVIRIPEN